MNSIGDKIVFAQLREGRDHLYALNAALRQAFEEAGFDCEERFTPHLTMMKVRRKKLRMQVNGSKDPSGCLYFQTGGKFSAQGGIPREAFTQFTEHSFGSQVLQTEPCMSPWTLPMAVIYLNITHCTLHQDS